MRGKAMANTIRFLAAALACAFALLAATQPAAQPAARKAAFFGFVFVNTSPAPTQAEERERLAMIEERSRQRKGEEIDKATHDEILGAVRASYNEQQDIRHGAARGWIDRVIEPHKTREELIEGLRSALQGWDMSREFKTGVLQT